MRLTDHVLDRCEDTMRHTGHTILCWLRSTKHHQARHSAELVQGAKSNLCLEMGLGLQRPKRGNSCLAAGRGKAVAEADALTSVPSDMGLRRRDASASALIILLEW
jgi:hypothetical protein